MAGGEGEIITELFVYGTLKRGQCRQSLWPRKPTRVSESFICGRLYDLGPYPAIRVDGDDAMETHGFDLDWIAGELWTFHRGDMPATLAVLDEIEQTNQPGRRNLYDHVLVRAYERPRSATSQLTLVYQYSDAYGLDHSLRVRPYFGEDVVSWPAEPAAR